MRTKVCSCGLVVRIVSFRRIGGLRRRKQRKRRACSSPVDESIDLTASEAYANCFIVTGGRRVSVCDAQGRRLGRRRNCFRRLAVVDKECSGKPVGFRGLLQRRYRAFHVGWYGRQYRVGGFRCEGRGDLELASMDDRSAGAVRLRRGRRIDGSQSRSDQRPGSRRGGLPSAYSINGDAKIPFTAAKKNEDSGDGVFLRARESTIVNPAHASLAWIAVQCDEQVGTVAYATAHPTTFLFNSPNGNKDWLFTGEDALWDNAGEEDELRSMSRRLPGAGSGRMGQYLLVQRGRRAEQRRQVLYDGLRCEDLVPAFAAIAGETRTPVNWAM